VEYVFYKAWIPLGLYFKKAELASRRSKTIKEWKAEDKVKDDKVANAIKPQHKRCESCSHLLKNCHSCNLMHNHIENKEEVVFMFKCDNCDKLQPFWENGDRWVYEPECTKCHRPLIVDHDRKGMILTTTSICEKCKYTEVDTMDLSEKEEIDPDFEKKRQKYCISETEGNKIMYDAKQMRELVNDTNEREENKDRYDAVKNIKKLTVYELQELLMPIIKKNGYVNIDFEKPQIQKDIIIGFNLQDAKSDREEYDSIHELQKLIKKILEPTNWRLMSDGVSYKLGFLQGRLHGYDGEESLLKLVKK